MSRWDTGSRETGSRGRSRGSSSDRDWEPEERGRRAGREVPTASVFLKVWCQPACASVAAAATGAECVGVCSRGMAVCMQEANMRRLRPLHLMAHGMSDVV